MKGFKNTPKFQKACDDIVCHTNANEQTKDFIQSVANTCQRTGYVTYKQAKCVGGTYKMVVNNGVFVNHDWWS